MNVSRDTLHGGDSDCQQLLYTAAKIRARLSSYSCVDSKCFMLLSFFSRTSGASPVVSLEIEGEGVAAAVTEDSRSRCCFADRLAGR